MARPSRPNAGAPYEGQPNLEWCAADHAMRSAKARATRKRFLATTLGLA